MKKLLITVCLSGLLSVPSAVLGAEMAGASLYGSFRTGLMFGDGDAEVSDIGSRWGIKGSHEVAEGLTASYNYEGKIDTTNAESFGGAGHSHAAVAATDEVLAVVNLENAQAATAGDYDEDDTTDQTFRYACTDRGNPIRMLKNGDGMVTGHQDITDEDFAAIDTVPTVDVFCGNVISHTDAGSDKIDADGGPGGRLSNISLSGGFGSITLGQIWSASAIHYGFALDGSYWNGTFGGASARIGNVVSYSSSAGDVSFQIDKTTGDDERLEFGASATLGPVGVGLGYFSTEKDASFTGLAVAAGAAGVDLTIGLGSSTSATGAKSKTNILRVAGSVGDSGLSYSLQLANSNKDGGEGDSNLLIVTNSLGSGASLIFEHVSPGDDESSSLLGLKVDF